MTGSDRVVVAGAAAPRPRTGAPAARIDDALVVAVLASLAGAGSSLSVAEAPLPALLDLDGVRGVAVLARERGSAVVLASAGYDCGEMAPGATLPMDAGLPATEALRRRALVVQGRGPSWVALPFERDGVLLLSLDAPPPQEQAELWRLQRIARTLGDALRRASGEPPAAVAPAAVPSQPTGLEVAVRSLPYAGPVGGDVALCLPDGRGGDWLLVADVCGYGAGAAAVASVVSAAAVALAPSAAGPADLLLGWDRVARTVTGAGSFVTALALHVADGQLSVASAGHPPPLLLDGRGGVVLELQPSPPLALETGPWPAPADLVADLPDGAVVLLHTDGLLDRRGPGGPVAADVRELVAGASLDDLDGLADHLLEQADAVGAAGDDVTLMVARPLSQSSG